MLGNLKNEIFVGSTYKVTVEMDYKEYRDLIGNTEEGQHTDHYVSLSHNKTLTEQLNKIVRSIEIKGVSGEELFGHTPLKVFQNEHIIEVENDELKGRSFDITQNLLGFDEEVN